MIVLLDENLDHGLRKYLSEHEIVTVSFMGWAGLKNGALLQKAEDRGIEVFITGDKTLPYEQNRANRQIAIIVLSSIELPILQGHLPTILAAIANSIPGTIQRVDCGSFSRKRGRGDE